MSSDFCDLATFVNSDSGDFHDGSFVGFGTSNETKDCNTSNYIIDFSP